MFQNQDSNNQNYVMSTPHNKSKFSYSGTALCESEPKYSPIETSSCVQCGEQFGVFKRKKFCKCCHNNFCSACLSKKLKHDSHSIGSDRVCDYCYHHRELKKDPRCLWKLVPYLHMNNSEYTNQAINEILQLSADISDITEFKKLGILGGILKIISNSQRIEELTSSMEVLCLMLDKNVKLYESSFFDKAVKSLPRILKLESKSLKILVLNAVDYFCQSDMYLSYVYKSYLPYTIFENLKTDDKQIQESVLSCLHNLLLFSKENSELVSLFDNIDVFLLIMSDNSEIDNNIAKLCSSIVNILSNYEYMKEKIFNKSGMDILSRMAKSPNKSVKLNTILTIISMNSLESVRHYLIKTHNINNIIKSSLQIDDISITIKVLQFIHSTLMCTNDIEEKELLVVDILQNISFFGTVLSLESVNRKYALDVMSVISTYPIGSNEDNYEGCIVVLISTLINDNTKLTVEEILQSLNILINISVSEKVSNFILNTGAIQMANQFLISNSSNLIVVRTLRLLAKLSYFEANRHFFESLNIEVLYTILFSKNVDMMMEAVQLLQNIVTNKIISENLMKMKAPNQLLSVFTNYSPTLQSLVNGFLCYLLINPHSLSYLENRDSSLIKDLIKAVNPQNKSLSSLSLNILLLLCKKSEIIRSKLLEKEYIQKLSSTIEYCSKYQELSDIILKIMEILLIIVQSQESIQSIANVELLKSLFSAILLPFKMLQEMTLILISIILPKLHDINSHIIYPESFIKLILDLMINGNNEIQKVSISILSRILSENPSSINTIGTTKVLDVIWSRLLSETNIELILECLTFLGKLSTQLMSVYFNQDRVNLLFELTKKWINNEEYHQLIDILAYILYTVSLNISLNAHIETLMKIMSMSTSNKSSSFIASILLQLGNNRTDLIKIYNNNGIKFFFRFIRKGYQEKRQNDVILGMKLINQFCQVPHYLKEVIEEGYLNIVFPMIEEGFVTYTVLITECEHVLKALELGFKPDELSFSIPYFLKLVNIIPLDDSNDSIVVLNMIVSTINRLIDNKACMNILMENRGSCKLLSILLKFGSRDSNLVESILSCMEHIIEVNMDPLQFNDLDVTLENMKALIGLLPDSRVIKVIQCTLKLENSVLPESYFDKLANQLADLIVEEQDDKIIINPISSLSLLFRNKPIRLNPLNYISIVSKLIPFVESYANLGSANFIGNIEELNIALTLIYTIISNIHVSQIKDIQKNLFIITLKLVDRIYSYESIPEEISLIKLLKLFVQLFTQLLLLSDNVSMFLQHKSFNLIIKALQMYQKTKQEESQDSHLEGGIIHCLNVVQNLVYRQKGMELLNQHNLIEILNNILVCGVDRNILIGILRIMRAISIENIDSDYICKYVILPLVSLLYNDDEVILSYVLTILYNMSHYPELSSIIRICIDEERIIELIKSSSQSISATASELKSLLLIEEFSYQNDEEEKNEDEQESNYVSTIEIMTQNGTFEPVVSE